MGEEREDKQKQKKRREWWDLGKQIYGPCNTWKTCTVRNNFKMAAVEATFRNRDATWTGWKKKTCQVNRQINRKNVASIDRSQMKCYMNCTRINRDASLCLRTVHNILLYWSSWWINHHGSQCTMLFDNIWLTTEAFLYNGRCKEIHNRTCRETHCHEHGWFQPFSIDSTLIVFPQSAIPLAREKFNVKSHSFYLLSSMAFSVRLRFILLSFSPVRNNSRDESDIRNQR